MKNIYNAPNKDVAATELDNLERKWGGKYPYAIYDYAIRKMALVLIDCTCRMLSYRVIVGNKLKLPQTKTICIIRQ